MHWDVAITWYSILPLHSCHGRLPPHATIHRVSNSVAYAGDVITPDEVFEVLDDDVKAADLILWVGISFEQSASTVYFKKVRHFLQVMLDCAHGIAMQSFCNEMPGCAPATGSTVTHMLSGPVFTGVLI